MHDSNFRATFIKRMVRLLRKHYGERFDLAPDGGIMIDGYTLGRPEDPRDYRDYTLEGFYEDFMTEPGQAHELCSKRDRPRCAWEACSEILVLDGRELPYCCWLVEGARERIAWDQNKLLDRLSRVLRAHYGARFEIREWAICIDGRRIYGVDDVLECFDGRWASHPIDTIVDIVELARLENVDRRYVLVEHLVPVSHGHEGAAA